MDQSYNYQKIYFRRNFFNSSNRRFGYILASMAIAWITTTLILMNWAKNISWEVITSDIKTNYVAFLEREFAETTIPEESRQPKEKTEYFDQIQPEPFSAVKEAVQNIDTLQKLVKPEDSELADNFYKDQMSGKEVEILPITAAVERVPTLSEFPVFGQRREKQLTLQNESSFLRKFTKPIHIERPEVTKFASENGNRDIQETSAIIGVNEAELKYCIEKFSRYNPDFSGDVSFKFTIHPDGYVIPSSIKVLDSNIPDFRIITCLKKNIRRWRNFPKIAMEDGNFTVTRKYIF